MKLKFIDREIKVTRVPHASPMLTDCEALVQDNQIFISKKLVGRAFWHALIHEALHLIFPYKDEKDIHTEAFMLTEFLLESGLLKEPE